ncbi:exopolysaccharide biosynthesis protein [soil metagenome]
MASPETPSPAAPQVARLKKYDAVRSVDMHCHCLAGLDDGPPTGPDSIALCKLLVRDGFTDVIATPHQLGRYDGVNWAPEVRQGVASLQTALTRERIPLRVHAGAEIRIDERIPSLLEADRLLTLADLGQYLLLELPTSSNINPDAVAAVLARANVHIVLAHAERYDNLRRDPGLAKAWLDTNIILQVNASSLLDEAPANSREAAISWLSQGWIALVATDSHSAANRRPRMTEAIDFIERQFGVETARQLCITNPAKLLDPA